MFAFSVPIFTPQTEICCGLKKKKKKKILYKEIKETVWGAKISGDWSTQ